MKVVFNKSAEGVMHDHKNRIAEGAFCSVDACECGTFHVTLGPVTVRLQMEVVESIWVTLGEAMHRMAARNSASEAPSAPDRVRAS